MRIANSPPEKLLDRLELLVLSKPSDFEEAEDIIEIFRSILTEYCNISDKMFNFLVFGDDLNGGSKYLSLDLLNEMIGDNANISSIEFKPTKDNILRAAGVLRKIVDSKIYNLIINMDILEEKVNHVILSYFVDMASSEYDIDTEEIIDKYIDRELDDVNLESIHSRLIDASRVVNTNSLLNLVDMMRGPKILDGVNVIERTLLGDLTSRDNDVTVGGTDERR